MTREEHKESVEKSAGVVAEALRHAWDDGVGLRVELVKRRTIEGECRFVVEIKEEVPWF